MCADTPNTLPKFAVETSVLSKTYPAERGGPVVEALKSVSLTIPRGSFFGLLGPNGAGKSTLINILAGLVLKTSGEARIWNFNIERQMRQARRAIGVVPQEPNIAPFITPRALLDLQAGLYGMPKAERRSDEVLQAVGLSEKAHAYARSLSGGMRRRLLVAKAMVHSPQVLVLDEPSAGVDVDLRRQLWTHVRDMNRRGTTVLLTTHYLEEAETLCDTIAIINHGRLIACDPTERLLARIDSKQMTVTLNADLSTLPTNLHSFNAELRGSRHVVFSYAPSRINSGQILAAIDAAGLCIADLTTREAELEDIFLRLTSDSGGDSW